MAGSTFKDPNIGPTGVAVPAEAGQIGGPDAAGLLRAPRLYDTDTGGGTENTLGVVLRASAGGGSVEAGTAGNPLRIDPTGATAQPVSQGAGAGAAAPWAVQLSDGAAFYQAPVAAQLPAALVGGRLDSNIGAWLGSTAPTVGQKAMVASIPVVLASDQAAIPVSQSGAWAVTANVGTTGGLALDATLTGGTAKAIARGGAKGATAAADVTSTAEGADHQALDVQLYSGGAAVSPATSAQLPAALVGGRLDANVGAWFGSTTPTVGQKTMAASLPVTIASDQPAIPVSLTVATSSVAGQSSVAGSAASTTILAANAARKGATVFNDSGAILYLKLGATASLTSFTVRMAPYAYYEVPFSWVGVIDGIWSEAVGSARITELT